MYVHISFATLLHHHRAPCLSIYSFYSSCVVPSNKMTERGQRFTICFFTMLFLSKWKKFNLETSFFTARYTLVSYVVRWWLSWLHKITPQYRRSRCTMEYRMTCGMCNITQAIFLSQQNMG